MFENSMDPEMQPGTMSLFLVLAIHLGLFSVIEAAQTYPCDLKIVEGKAMSNHAVFCQGLFPCDVDIRGQLLYSLKCTITSIGSYICDGVCPHQTGHFSSVCKDGGWSLDLGILCWYKAKQSPKTTNSPRDDVPTDGDDSLSYGTVMLIAFMPGILVLIMICMCLSCGMKSARKRRQREPEPVCDLHLDRDLNSESLPSPAVVDKPPSYEEVISSDAFIY